MKTNVSHSDSQKADKSEASKQASAETILQAYKTGTSQLQTAEEEPVQPKENKTGLPDNLKSGVENLSGHSLDDVKVHYNSSQPASLQAHAYAQGTDIHVAPGQEKH
ncbi:MAG: eCIS core domain-containing protein, partial [Fluviicola sp.]